MSLLWQTGVAVSGDERYRRRLYEYIGRTVHDPIIRKPTATVSGVEPRQISDFDLEPLRFDEDWNPQEILTYFGVATHPEEYLPRLLVAAAVALGPHWIRSLAEALIHLLAGATPRLKRMTEDPAIVDRVERLAEIMARSAALFEELHQTKARAQNDEEMGQLSANRLCYVDLRILVEAVEVAVALHELSTRRNVTGIDFALKVAAHRPSVMYAEEWSERVLGAQKLPRVLFFWPQEWGRLVLVYRDGRLAYDPIEEPQPPDLEDLGDPYTDYDDDPY
jgi:hypothetical protein